MNESNLPQLSGIRQKFELTCNSAKSLRISNNFGAAFEAVTIVKTLRELLTDEIMEAVFMPLMNTKIGFLTDRTGKPDSKGNAKPLYSISVVRDVIIDAVSCGLKPTGNEINIISERMYPTKEGYTSLLRDLGVKNIIDVGIDDGSSPNSAKIPVKISYEFKGEKNSFSIIATVKKDSYSSHDQLRGKAERRGKKALYEYLTGFDLGDADEDSSKPIDVEHEDVTSQFQKLNFKDEDEARSFFIKDLGKSPESVKGKFLYEVAKNELVELNILSNNKANQKKEDLRDKKKSGNSAQATLM